MPSPAPTAAAPPSAEAVAAELHLAVGRIARALRQAHTIGDLTHAEASTLARLETSGPDCPSSLAEGERVSPQAMATTLTGLEGKGFVERRPDPRDGRRVIISLTPLGAEVRRSRRTESARRLEQGLTAALDEGELRRLAQALPLLDRLAKTL